MTQIFISYSRKDLAIAEKVIDALAKYDFEPWIDWKSIPKGEAFESEIQQGIEKAEIFLFLVSPDSVKSGWCNKEIAHAVKNGKRILPIVIRDADLKSIHPEISKRNWIFCRDRQDDFSGAIEETHKTIHTDYEWLKYHTELQVKALKWEGKKDASRLLRGKELREAEKQLVETSNQEDPQPTKLQREYILASQRNEVRTRRQITIGITIGFIVVSVFCVAAIAASIIAVGQRNIAISKENSRATAQADAEQKARISRANELAIQSNSIDSRFPQLKLLLAIESTKVTVANIDPPVPSAEQALRDALNKSNGIALESIGGVTAFNSDDQWLAVGDEKGSINFYNLSLTTNSSQFTLELGMPVKKLSFSSQDSWLLAENENTYSLWQKTNQGLDSYKLVKKQVGITKVEVSNNNQWLVAINNDSVFIHNLKNFAANTTIIRSETRKLEDLALSDDSQWLLLGTSDGYVGILHLNDNNSDEAPMWLKISSTPTYNIVSSENWVVTNSGEAIRVWKLEDGILNLNFVIKPQQPELGSHLNEPRIIGNYLAYEDNGQVYVLRISDSKNQPVFITSTFLGPYGISPDGHWAIHAGGAGSYVGIISDIFTWKLDDYPNVYQGPQIIGSEGIIDGFTFSHNGRWMVSTVDQQNRLWDTWLWTTGSLSPACNYEHFLNYGDYLLLPQCRNNDISYWIPGPKFTSDGKFFAIAIDSKIFIWQTDHLPINKADIILDHKSKITHFNFSLDGQQVATSDFDGSIKLWNIKNFNTATLEPVNLKAQINQITFLKFSPDGHWLLAGDTGGSVILWDLELKDAYRPIKLGTYEQLNGQNFLFSPDSNWLMVNVYKETPLIYYLKDKKNIKGLVLKGNPSTFYYKERYNFSPDSKWLFYFDGKERLFRWRLGENNTSYDLLSNEIPFLPQAVIFSNDWKYVVIGDKKTFEVWNASDLLKSNFYRPKPLLKGESQDTLLDLISNDNRWLIFTNYSLLNLETLERKQLVPGPTHLLGGPVFSNDSRSVILTSDLVNFRWDLAHLDLPYVGLAGGSLSGPGYFSPNNEWFINSDQYHISVTYLDISKLIDRACLVAGRNLTQIEWQRFFLGEEYRITCPQWPAGQ